LGTIGGVFGYSMRLSTQSALRAHSERTQSALRAPRHVSLETALREHSESTQRALRELRHVSLETALREHSDASL